MNKETDESVEFEGFPINKLEKKFKKLAMELKKGGHSLNELIINVDNINNRNSEDLVIPYYRDYIPTVYDYLERANTNKQCLEIINYCLSKAEISEEEANNLKERLRKGGPRAFGTRKPGYYDAK